MIAAIGKKITLAQKYFLVRKHKKNEVNHVYSMLYEFLCDGPKRIKLLVEVIFCIFLL